MPELNQSTMQLPIDAEGKRLFFLHCAEYYELRTSHQKNCSMTLTAMQKERGKFDASMWIECWGNSAKIPNCFDYFFAALDHPEAWQSLITAQTDKGVLADFACLVHTMRANIPLTADLNFNHFEHMFAQKMGSLISDQYVVKSRVDEVLLACENSPTTFAPNLTLAFETYCNQWLHDDSKEFQDILSGAAKKLLGACLTNPVLGHLSFFAQLGSVHALCYLANFFVDLSERLHDFLISQYPKHQTPSNAYFTAGTQCYALPLVFLFHYTESHIEKLFAEEAYEYQRFILKKLTTNLEVLTSQYPSYYHNKLLNILDPDEQDDSTADSMSQQRSAEHRFHP